MTEEQGHHRHPIGQPIEQEADALINPDRDTAVPPPDQMSLLRRLREPRTILSIVVPLAIVVIAAFLNQKYLAEIPADIGRANPWLVLLAFLIYYAGFPLRGLRWTRLLRGAGYRVKVKDGTEILFLSWLVNCIVPAKLGDLYRAYLLKLNSPVSTTKTLGTVFMERILDLIAIAALGLLAGYWRFTDSLSDLPETTQLIFAIAVVVVVLLLVALVVMRNFGRRVMAALPLPRKVVDFYDRFEEGVFGSVGARGLPMLGVLTVLIWMSEAMRLYFVGMGLVLTTVFKATSGHALAIVLVDRAISVFSIVVLGSIAYVISSKPRGRGIEVEEMGASGAPPGAIPAG